MRNKVLFICKKRLDSYGVSFGLINSATFVANYLNHVGVESKVITVFDANEVDKVVSDYNPTHIVLEALWVTPSKIKELLQLNRHKDREWVVRLHSKAPFIANEGIAFSWLFGYVDIANQFKNFRVSANDLEFNNDLKDTIGLRMTYLPNIYMPILEPKEKKHRHKKKEINIGCFGALRPMKNHLIQAMAAIMFANERGMKLKFHINAGRVEQNGDQVLKNLRGLFAATSHELVEHPWMTYREFIEIVSQMDLGMQVSLSETFNIVSADFVYNNVSIVTSAEISWTTKMLQANPNSTASIKAALWRAWYFGFLNSLNRAGLEEYNTQAKLEWFNYLHSCDGSF